LPRTTGANRVAQVSTERRNVLVRMVWMIGRWVLRITAVVLARSPAEYKL
jgi:hypothetical protein